MTCLVEFEPNSLWHEISLAITAQALRRRIKVEYHVFQNTPEQIRSALKRMGVDLDKFERESSFRIMDSYTSTTALAGSTEGVREPLLSGKSPDIELWTKTIRDKMKDGFEKEEKRWLHIDDNETTLLQFSDEESILNGWRTTFVPMAKSRELLILHGLVVGIASESFYRKTETMADAVIDVRTREEGGRLENYIRLRSLRESKFDSRWHKIELTNDGNIEVEASDSEQSRRLVAIMFTDIAGYTALAQSDENQALEVLKRHNRLLRPFFPKYHGREIKTIGDSFLIEFSSALDAANCAIEIQKFLHDYNISTKEDWKIKLRIGIHLGDVIHDGKDILGDAVNIASRIEPLADPEGICVSEQVYDQIHNKISCPLDLLESAKLKNVRFQTNVYAVVLPWEESKKRVDSRSVTTSKLDPLRVAVLPFSNISPDPNDEYFADGLTEELISTMSKISNLKVIARTSVMRYRGDRNKSLVEIANELKVGTILEGSVRKAKDKLRITAQLIGSETSEHLWSETYDKDLGDIFAIQSDIAKKVGDAVKVQIQPNEVSKFEREETRSTSAYTLYLKGRYYWNERSKESLLKAIGYFTQATKIDNRYAQAYAALADCYLVLGNHRYQPYQEAYKAAKDNALRAIKIDDSTAEAHFALASVLTNQYDWLAAEREFKKGLRLNPNYATGHHWYGVFFLLMGRFDEALREAELALQLDPLSLQISSFRGLVYTEMGKYDEAERIQKKIIESEPEFIPSRDNLRWNYFLAGEYSEAEKISIELLRMTDDPTKKADREGMLAAVYAFSGKTDQARKFLDELIRSKRDYYVPIFPIILTYIGLGDKERAIKLIEKEYEEHADWLPELSFEPIYERLRSDPRISQILKKINLEN